MHANMLLTIEIALRTQHRLLLATYLRANLLDRLLVLSTQ